MSKVKIQQVEGFSKVEALETVNLSTKLDGANATQAWVKAGSPGIDSNAFAVFVSEQLQKRTKLVPGLGAYVVVEAGVKDSRERPYKVISVATEGARKYKTVHQIVEAEVTTKIVKEKSTNEEGVEEIKEVIKVVDYELVGLPVAEADTKGDALDKMKDLISENKTTYVVVNTKVEVSNQSVEAFGLYTPSVSAKMGTYIVFGIEA